MPLLPASCCVIAALGTAGVVQAEDVAISDAAHLREHDAEAGESPMWVAQQMGHKDWTMIARVYGKWIKDAQPEAANKAVAMFANGGTKATGT